MSEPTAIPWAIPHTTRPFTKEEIDALDAPLPITPEEFEQGGGFEYADAVEAGLQARLDETLAYGGRGFMVSTMDMMWLLHAYRVMKADRP